MVVAAIRLWTQVRGKSKTPFHEWAVGWGALFFMLALLSEAAPGTANSLAILVAFTDFLVNGVNLTTDLSNIITGSETGNVLVDQPFSGMPQPATIPKR
jgi:hypothetical protein